jgi:serine/threonine protein kinase
MLQEAVAAEREESLVAAVAQAGAAVASAAQVERTALAAELEVFARALQQQPGTQNYGGQPYPNYTQCGSQSYDFSTDMWAAGCVLAEMYKGKTCFSGTNTLGQLDQVRASDDH